MGGRGGSGRASAGASAPIDLGPALDEAIREMAQAELDRRRAMKIISLEDRVRAAYNFLTSDRDDEDRGYVSLADIRDMVGHDVSMADFNEALRMLNRQSDVNVIPESNQKVLTARDRAAQVVIGNQNKHLIHIERRKR